jgi:hypothetical protein
MSDIKQAAAPPNPLQLGQTLYEVLDVTLIGTPQNASAASYHRVIYNSAGGTPVEPLELVDQSRILDVKAATDMHAAVQSVFVLTAEQVQVIGSAKGAAVAQTWPVSGLSTIVGLDPQQLSAPHLLLLGQDAQGTFLRSLDCSSGTLADPVRLPATVTGTVAAAVLVRHQLDAHLVVCMLHEGRLTAYDLGSSVLGATPAVPTAAALAIGTAPASAVVGVITAGMVAGSADEQVVISYPNSSGSVSLTVLGWTDQTLGIAATAEPDLSFAAPESGVFRVAAGDLLGNGADQLVVGYGATFQSVKGCAALVLFELQTPADAAQSLQLLSTYVAANTDEQPFASLDLHLAVGLFGEPLPADQPVSSRDGTAGVLGVLMIGAGATFAQVLHGQASVLAALVPVNPITKAFPPVGHKPAVPAQISALMTVDYRASSLFALPSDVTGQSVILGPPRLSESLGKGQLLAVIQAPPYEEGVSASKPSLTFGQSVSQIEGYNVSSNKSWMFSQDTATSIGISGQTLSRNVSTSYGNGFDQLHDSSTSTLVQSTATISDNDLIVLYAMSYYVWVYPLYRKAKQDKPDGSIAVIFPTTSDPIQTIIPASDPSIGYKPRSQSGLLLSYVDVPRDGYDESQLLFEVRDMSVTDDTAGSGVVYDKTKMVGDNVTKSFMVHNSTTDSAHFSYSTTLLDYIPVNFGLNLSDGQTYSESGVQTTMLSHTTTMSITMTSGSVSDIGYSYLIYPYIYQHQTMGCLMVTYDVHLSGKSWDDYYKAPQVLLQSLYPHSKQPLLAGFSRSISFQDNPDGTVKVSVELFNNSNRTTLRNVICEFYQGPPTASKDTLATSGEMVSKQALPTLLAGERNTVCANLKLKLNDEVVVSVYSDGLSTLNRVYWGIYPPSAFAESRVLRAAAAVEER